MYNNTKNASTSYHFLSSIVAIIIIFQMKNINAHLKYKLVNKWFLKLYKFIIIY